MGKITDYFVIIVLLFIACDRDKQITDPEIGNPTTLRGKLSGILSLQESPYIIDENIFVDSLDVLEIENGVQLFFKSGTYFSIFGTLNANGMRESPILFKSLSKDSSWRGIHIWNSPDTVYFKFCIIENVSILWNDADTLEYGALSLHNSSGMIENCIFRDNFAQSGGAVAAINASVSIKNSLLLENESVVFGGAALALQSSIVFINNTVYDNLCTNIGGGLVLYRGLFGEIRNNIFHQNWGQTGDPRIHIEQTNSLLVQVDYNFLAVDTLKPGFVNAQKPNQDFHLGIGSICIDAGNPDPQFNDPDGSRNDQGAYGGGAGNW